MPFGRFRGKSRRHSSSTEKHRRGAIRKKTEKKRQRQQLNFRQGWQKLSNVLSLIVIAAFFVGVIAAVPVGWFWLNRPVASIGIEGELQWNEQASVKAALLPHIDQRMLQVDLEEMRQSLLRLPGVAEASVKRSWPDRLEVSVTDKVAIARWSGGGLLDKEGRIFRPAKAGHDATAQQKLPQLQGPDGSQQEVLQQYLMLSRLLRPLGLSLDRLELNALGGWRLFCDDVEIVLGRQRLQQRVHRLVSLYNGQLERQWLNVRRIDLRYSSAVAVAWVSGKNSG